MSETDQHIPFNRPYMTGREQLNLEAVLAGGKLSGDGPFTQRCQDWLQAQTGAHSLLVHSCTAALEMMALLLELGPGDEVILPSYTFVSTASAFALRGVTLRYVDIREDTLNIDETRIEAAITPATRAICVVHYAGVSCAMDEIMTIARRHQLWVCEDAAQGLMASYQGRPLGSIGHLGAFSFHETKNIVSGEGGALLVNDSALSAAAEICREKGTDRSQFLRGEVDKYSWQALGSSYLPGELIAAFLAAQLDAAEDITRQRLALWKDYHQQLDGLEAAGSLRRPIVPADCEHNAHMYAVLLNSDCDREALIARLREAGVQAASHYVPLHQSVFGQQRSGAVSLPVTESLAPRLLRLPLWAGMSEQQLARVVHALVDAL